MNRQDYLGLYAKGWTEGNAGTILQAVDDAYVFDDPNVSRVSKANFTTYFSKLTQTVQVIRKAHSGLDSSPPRFMEITEVVTSDEGDVLTAWCWWTIPGTNIQGSGLIKVGNSGVLSERISYYARLTP